MGFQGGKIFLCKPKLGLGITNDDSVYGGHCFSLVLMVGNTVFGDDMGKIQVSIDKPILVNPRREPLQAIDGSLKKRISQ